MYSEERSVGRGWSVQKTKMVDTGSVRQRARGVKFISHGHR